MHRFETKGVKHYTADFSYKELQAKGSSIFLHWYIKIARRRMRGCPRCLMSLQASRWQLGRPAAAVGQRPVAARAVYVTEQMTWVLLKYGHQSRSLMPLVEVKKFARLICQFCISLPALHSRPTSPAADRLQPGVAMKNRPKRRRSLLTSTLFQGQENAF